MISTYVEPEDERYIHELAARFHVSKALVYRLALIRLRATLGPVEDVDQALWLRLLDSHPSASEDRRNG